MGGSPAEPTLGSRKYRQVRGRGGNTKLRVLKDEYINVSDTKGKTIKTKILEVVHNPSNVDYDRRGVLTKGAVVKTELGEAKISSRPSRGIISGILIEK